VMPYVEGGVPRDIVIAGNVFADVNPIPHGATVNVYAHTFGRGVPRLRNIVVAGNTFLRSGGAAVALESVSGGVVATNRIERPIEQTAMARPGDPRRQQAIRLSRCADIRVEGNAVIDPGCHLAPDAVTGSPVLGCDNRCERITLDGRPDATFPMVNGP
jgi:hypothetical protein